MTEPIYKGEAILLNWNDNKSGRKIVLQLEKDGPGSHPFDGLDGERFAVVIIGPLATDKHANSEPVARKGKAGDVPTREDGSRLTKPSADTAPATTSGAAPGKTPAGGGGQSNAAVHKKWDDMPPSSRAALLCKQPEFWNYLSAMAMDGEGRAPGYDALTAEAELKTRLDVERKSHIVEGSRAAAELSRMIGNYNAYRQAKGHGVV